MSFSSHKYLMLRMNFNEDYETIILLEDNGVFDISQINDISNSSNEINNFLNTINVKYENLFEIEEKQCLINDLKNNFDFIKIIYNNENTKNEINYLVLKNKNYSADNILQKINEKAIFGNEIKKILNINSFPLDNYYLEENDDDKEQYFTYFNKIYELKKKDKKIII